MTTGALGALVGMSAAKAAVTAVTENATARKTNFFIHAPNSTVRVQRVHLVSFYIDSVRQDIAAAQQIKSIIIALRMWLQHTAIEFRPLILHQNAPLRLPIWKKAL